MSNINVKIGLPEAHSKKQAYIMQALTNPNLKRLYVSCGTKYGKTLSATVATSNLILSRDFSLFRWIAPIYAQSKIGLKYMEKMLPPKPHTKVSQGKMLIEMPYLQNEIEFWHTKHPESLEGVGSSGNIFDEASKCPYEAVVSARTTITMTKGVEAYFSTPLGKNWFYKECMYAKERMLHDYKNNKLPEYVFLTARTEENPHISKDIINEARRTLPTRLFNQYYLAEFVDDGAVFRGYRECIRGTELQIEGIVQEWIKEGSSDCDVILGADWARQNDYTVFTALKVTSDKSPELIGFKRFTGVSYVEVMKELVLFKKKFKSVRLLKHDKTGVGIAIDDMLSHTNINFEGVTFTNASKSLLVNKLMMAFETKDIIIPNWPELIKELESFTVTTNLLGTAKYEAQSGFHDDIICSLMLAYYSASEYSLEFKISFLDDENDDKLNINKFYNELADDDDY